MGSRIDLFYYGDVGSHDENNPYTLFRRSWIPEILFQIASNDRFQLSASDISEKLGIPKEDVAAKLSQMERLGMVSRQGSGYSLAFPVVLEKDIPALINLSSSIAFVLSEQFLSKRAEIEQYASKLSCAKCFGLPRVLYHVLGCDFLDGGAMTELSHRQIIGTSKPQPGGRDYILFGYESSEAVAEINDMLLCSRNSTGNSDLEFVSFGDCNGNRNDLFRFVRQATSLMGNVSGSCDLNSSYIPLFERHTEDLISSCARVASKILASPLSMHALDDQESEIALFLKNLNYVTAKNGYLEIAVPVFWQSESAVINELCAYLFELIEEDVAEAFGAIGDRVPELSAIRHGVDEKEIANDLWHHVIGRVNQALIEEGMLADPEYRRDEGRYFQAMYTLTGRD